MLKKNKDALKEVLAKNFQKSEKAKFYQVKGLKKYSKTVIIKTVKKIDEKKLNQVQGVLRKQLNDPAIELLKWIDTVGGLIPRKNIYKAPLFDTDDIKEYSPWRTCPLGEHWVIRHLRQKKSLEDVDGHCRKNPTGKDIIKGDEIDQIAQSQIFKNVQIKTAQGILNDAENSDIYNDLIAGWTAFWNYQLKATTPLHPSYVKALIATESTFNPSAINPKNSKKIGPARGIMQVTVDTQSRLSGDRKELRDHFVILTDEEIWEPNKNICAGIRWLFRKREIVKSKLGREPSWEEVLMDYKGRLNSQNKVTQKIKDEIKKYLKQLGVK